MTTKPPPGPKPPPARISPQKIFDRIFRHKSSLAPAPYVPVITIERRQAFGTGGDGALRLCIDGVPILGQIGYSLSSEVDGPTLYECKLIVDGRKIRLVE